MSGVESTTATDGAYIAAVGMFLNEGVLEMLMYEVPSLRTVILFGVAAQHEHSRWHAYLSVGGLPT